MAPTLGWQTAVDVDLEQEIVKGRERHPVYHKITRNTQRGLYPALDGLHDAVLVASAERDAEIAEKRVISAQPRCRR